MSFQNIYNLEYVSYIMPIKDIEKRREYRRIWYSKNKKSEKIHVKRRKKEIQNWFQMGIL